METGGHNVVMPDKAVAQTLTATLSGPGTRGAQVSCLHSQTAQIAEAAAKHPICEPAAKLFVQASWEPAAQPVVACRGLMDSETPSLT